MCSGSTCILCFGYALVVCGGARSGGEGNCYGSSVPVLWLCCGPVVVAEVVLSYAVVVVSRAI